MIIEHQKEIHYCSHGCGQIANYYSPNTKKWRCCSYSTQCPKFIEQNKILFKSGYVSPFKGKHHTEESKEKNRQGHIKPHIFKDGLEYKECGHCKEIKLLNEFGIRNSNWDKLVTTCKRCVNNCYQNNKNEKKEYYQKNKSIINKRNNERRKTDVNFKLRMNLSIRILDALKYENIRKSDTTIKLLECSIEDAKQYIESLFYDNMIWQDFLDGDIELHHLQPCYTFDLSDPEQQKECFNINNLYPIWKADHKFYYRELHNNYNG